MSWHKGDAFKPDQWRDIIQNAHGAVSCLGAFGSNEVTGCLISFLLFTFSSSWKELTEMQIL